ncbi:MAG: SIS domain-containing protein [Lysobacterales bacterium]|jgi:arabinose-5-phosphate isomerase
MIEQVTEVLRHEAEAIANIPVTENFETATSLIHRHVHELGGKLVTSGLGKAGEIAQNIATTFSSTGTPAVFLHPAEAQHGDLGVLQPDDVMLLVSNSGETREVLELVELASRLYAGIPLVVITAKPDSYLARSADVCLLTGDPAEVCPLGLTPTTSTTVMTVIGDALIVLMMEKIGFTNVEYAKRHHGGYLGSKSRAQSGAD